MKQKALFFNALFFIVLLLAKTAGAQIAATVYTDKSDYQPGEVVIIQGDGWQPGEVVRLDIDHSTVTHGNTILYATADANGHIKNEQFVIQTFHLGESFILTATGLSSGLTATTTFTDANSFSATISPTTANSGANVTYTLRVSNLSTGGSAASLLSLEVAIPAGFTSISTTAISTSNNTSYPFVFETSAGYTNGYNSTTNVIRCKASGSGLPGATTPAPYVDITFMATSPVVSSQTNYTFVTQASDINSYDFSNPRSIPIVKVNGKDQQPVDTVLSCTAPAVISQPSSQSITYGGNTSFTFNSSSATYQWQEFNGTTWANISNGGVYAGVTTNTLTLTKPSASINGYQYRCQASFCTPPLTTTSNAVTLTVDKVNLNVTADNKNKIYGDANPAFTVSYSGFVTGENASSLTTQPTASSTATATSAVGSYPIVPAGGVSGNYIFNYVNGSLSISQRPINVTAQADNRVYNGTTGSSVAPLVDALQGGDVIGTAPIQTFNSRNVGSNKILTASGLVINDGNGGNNYIVSYITNNSGVITARDLNVTAQHDDRVYNGTTSSSIAPVVDDLQTGDLIGTTPTQSYDTRNIGSGKTLTASGLVINDGNSGLNYTIHYVNNTTGIISKKDINVTAQHDDRVYNGTTSSSIAPVVDDLQTGDLIGTTPTQSYDTRNIGSGKTLTASGLVINDGNSGLNYTIHYVNNTTGIISKKDINVTAQHDDRVYNGTTSSSIAPVIDDLQTGDLIGTTPTQSYDTRNIGSGKTLTASGLVINDGNSGLNYTIHYVNNTTGIISKKDINVTAQHDDRVYNGTTSSSIAPVVDDLQTGDLIGTTPTQSYDTRNIGSGKTLTASGLVINDGNSGLNYTIHYVNNTTGIISKKDINVTAQHDDRVYNGTTSSSVLPQVETLQTGDAIGTAPTQAYNTKHAGTNKTLTASGLVINDGNSGLNYSIHYVNDLTGIISRRDLDVTAQHDERVYNGNTSSSVVPITGSLQTGDVIGTAPIQTFNTKAVGTNKTLTPASLVINDGNGGLNYLVHYITDGTGIITAKDITGNITANNKVYDGNRNATIATRTLIGVIGYDAVTYTGGVATFDDVPPGTGQNVGTNKPVTATGLSLTGGDAINYTVNTTATTTANITQAGLIITANNYTEQYSDPVTFDVSYSGFAAGDGPDNLGGTLTYTTTPAATTGTNPAIATGAPGVYTITPAGLTSGNYSITFKTGTLTITKEDAQVTYTGLTLVATTTPSSTTANLTLSATIQDITALLIDPAYDAYAGDIRKATVTFNVDGVDKATVNIGLVNGSDTKTGTAVATITGVGIGDHTVMIKLNGYYIGTTAGDNSFVVEVYQNTGDFITGGGYLKLVNSNGQKPGDAGTKNNFGFNVKYNKSGTNLQGTINTIFRRMEGGVLHVYQVKGNSMTSLTVNGTATPPTAVFNGKASITDITNPASTISIGGNYTLQVSMTDVGEPGTNDKIGITVFNKDGGIWYTSNWNGSQTIQQTLGGGNLVVHGSNVGTAPIARTETGDPAQTVTTIPNNPFTVKVYGNPAEDHFNINIQGPAEKISLRVIDIRGRVIEWRENVPQGTLQLGQSYRKGFYYLEVWQGNHIRQLKLVKL